MLRRDQVLGSTKYLSIALAILTIVGLANANSAWCQTALGPDFDPAELLEPMEISLEAVVASLGAEILVDDVWHQVVRSM